MINLFIYNFLFGTIHLVRTHLRGGGLLFSIVLEYVSIVLYVPVVGGWKTKKYLRTN